MCLKMGCTPQNFKMVTIEIRTIMMKHIILRVPYFKTNPDIIEIQSTLVARQLVNSIDNTHIHYYNYINTNGFYS